MWFLVTEPSSFQSIMESAFEQIISGFWFGIGFMGSIAVTAMAFALIATFVFIGYFIFRKKKV